MRAAMSAKKAANIPPATVAAMRYTMPRRTTKRMFIRRWRMIAWAEKDTNSKVKYGPSALYVEVFEMSGMIRFVVVAPAPPKTIPSKRYLSWRRLRPEEVWIVLHRVAIAKRNA